MLQQTPFQSRFAPWPRWLAALGLVAACLLTRGDVFDRFDLDSVQVGGEIGRRIDITVTNNLLKLDLEKDFLAPFASKTRSGGYVGLGKTLDATARLARYTADPRMLTLRRDLVNRVRGLQEVDGYLGALAPEHRVQRLWDVHELSYLVYGLLTDYDLFSEEESLDAARRLGDYLLANWGRFPADEPGRTEVVTHVAVTGLERAMLALFRHTGDRRYRDFVTVTRALPRWDLGQVIGRRTGIEGHMYAYFCRCLAQTELYRLQPDPGLLRLGRNALDFLTVGNGMLLTGGAGQCEIWTNDQDGRGDLGETCSTAYQLRVQESLLRLQGQARLGDLMERTLWNTLFAAQSPDGRRLRYYAPIEGERVYFNGDSYCCPCNYRRIIAELPQMVCYRSGGGLAVNLFAPAACEFLSTGAGHVRVRMETAYPNDGRVTLRLDPENPARFPVQLRIPLWAGGTTLVCNDQPLDLKPVPGTFAVVDREWRPGDTLTMEMPMEWRLVRGRERQAGRIAVMRGPLVFCLDPSQNPQLAKLDPADLGQLRLDPDSLGAPVSDNRVRPDGIACQAGFWKGGFGLGAKHDYTLRLTEFPDPAGRATYFSLRDPAVGEEDVLLAESPF
ncbi:MAG: glycoside hydrolase family 127 protein [Verrucomicrobiales bacterium]|nr:glycoside hydrolase family 127 protein [Verrucomicrobiales bacterium]